MADKPHECLHCAIQDALMAWHEAYQGSREVEPGATLHALSKCAGELLAQAPDEKKLDVFRQIVEVVAKHSGVGVASRMFEIGDEPAAAGTKH